MDFTFIPTSEPVPIENYIARLSPGGGAFLSENIVGECYAIRSRDAEIGALWVDGNTLTGFFADPRRQCDAERILSAAAERFALSHALILTSDSPLVALCCERWKKTSVEAYCYEFAYGMPKSTPISLRCAKARDTQALLGSGYFRAESLAYLMKEHNVYVCEGDEGIAAFGTIEPCAFSPDYAAVGVFVAEKYRVHGIGSNMLARLAALCCDYGKKAVALCNAKNAAFARALESAGFVCYDKLLKAEF